jgi:hypothetical protein
LDDKFFNVVPETHPRIRSKLLTVTWSDITANDHILPRNIVSETVGINLSQLQYENIRNAYRSAYNRFKNNDTNTTNLDCFFSGFKKGSQPFRRILATTPCAGIGERGGGLNRTVNSFSSLIDCLAPNEKRIKSLFCSWNKWFLDSRMHIFKFKYYNNIIGLNSRVAHFNPDVTAECTLCNIAGPRPIASKPWNICFSHVPSRKTCYENCKKNICSTLTFKGKHFLGESFRKTKKRISARQFYLMYFGT